MYNTLCLLLIWYGGVANGFAAKKIEEEVNSYFSSENSRSFSDKWKVHRTSAENAIELALKETYGNPGLNVYVKTIDDTHKISDGFLVYDNIVHVLFRDLNLARWPYLKNPRVSFPLHENVLQVEATLSKMVLDAKYLLFRNFSDVVYSEAKEDKLKTSPFSLQQVQNRGQAAIIAEHCVLFGYAVASLQGASVALGHDNFQLDNCKFTLEISSPDVASPPVIVPYFTEEQGGQLERLLMFPLHSELMPKLQGAVLTCVNTSMVLGNLLPKIRKQQRSLFKKTSDYMTEVVKSLNKIVGEQDGASQLWEDFQLSWTDKYDDQLQTSIISLTNMTISGLDSAYTANIGGPCILGSTKIDEDVRFSGIQFRGSGLFQVKNSESQFMFSGEVQDVMTSATVQISIDDKLPKDTKLTSSKTGQTFVIRGWRNLEIHGPNSPLVNTYSLITGYLLNHIPDTVIRHLSRFSLEAIDDTLKAKFEAKSVVVDAGVLANKPDKSDENEENSATMGLPAEPEEKPFSGEKNLDGKEKENEDTDVPPDQDAPNYSKIQQDGDVEGSKEPMFKEKMIPEEADLLKDTMFSEALVADDNNDNPMEGNVEEPGESKQDVAQDTDAVRRKHFKKPVRLRNYKRKPNKARMSDNEINRE